MNTVDSLLSILWFPLFRRLHEISNEDTPFKQYITLSLFNCHFIVILKGVCLFMLDQMHERVNDAHMIQWRYLMCIEILFFFLSQLQLNENNSRNVIWQFCSLRKGSLLSSMLFSKCMSYTILLPFPLPFIRKRFPLSLRRDSDMITSAHVIHAKASLRKYCLTHIHTHIHIFYVCQSKQYKSLHGKNVNSFLAIFTTPFKLLCCL